MSTAAVIGSLAATLGARLYRGVAAPAVPALTQDPNSDITMYRVLWAYYEANGLYDELVYLLNQQSVAHEALLPLRNPANRVVEFYSAKLFPGANLQDALPIIDTTDAVKTAIEQVWKWSNFADQKQVFARWFAAYGDGFIKVVAKRDPSQVYFQLLQPETTTQIDHDNRGFLTYLRLDVPQVRRDAKGKEESFTLTEVWDKSRDSFRVWEHDKGTGAELQNLGTPMRDESIRQIVGDDFIPVVHARFKNTGKLRGSGAFVHALDKINEANREATRLNQMLFRHNKNTWVLRANAMTGDNRPLPPPRLEGEATGSPLNTVSIGDEEFYRLPGLSTLESLVPNLNYAAALSILQDHMLELERDLPELAYYRLREMGAQLSGRAVRLLLSDAVDRCLEARGNAENALIRADMMALTIGKATGALKVEGSFDAGSFDHAFKSRPVIPTSDEEDAQASMVQANAGLAWEKLGVSKRRWLEDHGYSPQEIEGMAREREAETQTSVTAAMDAFSRGVLGE